MIYYITKSSLKYLVREVVEMKIMVIETPKGFPPYKIRNAWLGSVLPVKQNEKFGLSFKATESGFEVNYKEAMKALRKNNKGAYLWWMRVIGPELTCLRFTRSCCRIVG